MWNGHMYGLPGSGMLLFAIVVGLVVWYAVRAASAPPGPPAPRPPEEVLRDRFARGEIDQTEFDARLTALRTSQQRPSGDR
jgi:putative membrane protein